jgi:hypothetical protein
VLQHGRVRGRFQPGAQKRILRALDGAWAARNGLTLQGTGFALLHDGAFDGGDGYSKTARGFSHGLTVGHRAHQTFFQIGRIGTHGGIPRIIHACLIFSQIALEQYAREAGVPEEHLPIFGGAGAPFLFARKE